jgi:hypothetical protein
MAECHDVKSEVLKNLVAKNGSYRKKVVLSLMIITMILLSLIIVVAALNNNIEELLRVWLITLMSTLMIVIGYYMCHLYVIEVEKAKKESKLTELKHRVHDTLELQDNENITLFDPNVFNTTKEEDELNAKMKNKHLLHYRLYEEADESDDDDEERDDNDDDDDDDRRRRTNFFQYHHPQPKITRHYLPHYEYLDQLSKVT